MTTIPDHVGREAVRLLNEIAGDGNFVWPRDNDEAAVITVAKLLMNPPAPMTDPDEEAAKGWDEALRGPRMSEATGKVIFKYQMPVLESFTMKLPSGAQIIRMEDQGGMFWLWAVVDTDAPMKDRQFMAFKTGAAMPRDVNLQYVGFCAVFVQMELGLYIFEVMP